MTEEQIKIKKKRHISGGDIFALLLILIIVAWLLVSGVNYVRYLRLDFAVAKEGFMSINSDAELLLIPKEQLVFADRSGVFMPTVAEGSRVKGGSVIGSLNQEQSTAYMTGNNDVISPSGGIISFNLDGLEGMLVEENIYDMDWQQVLYFFRETKLEETSVIDEAVNTSAGRTLAKIIDNLVDIRVFIYCPVRLSDVEVGDRLSFTFRNTLQNKDFSAYVGAVGSLNGQDGFLIASMGNREQLLLIDRYQHISVKRDIVEGVFIPSSSTFVDEEGKICVYYRNNHRLDKIEVQVLYENEGQVIITKPENDAKIIDNTQVVTNPRRATVGQKLY